MLRYLSIIFVVMCIGAVTAQIRFPGQCPKFKELKSFNFEKYQGVWYIYFLYPDAENQDLKCIYQEFTNTSGTKTVYEQGISTQTDDASSESATVEVIRPGQLEFVFNNVRTFKPNYIVMGTDYDNWAVVTDCRNATESTYKRELMVLVRNPQASAKALGKALSVVEKNGFPLNGFITADQFNCDSSDYTRQ